MAWRCSRGITTVAVGIAAVSASCVFELGEVVQSATGGVGGAGGTGGAMGPASGGGGTTAPTGFEVEITYASSPNDVADFVLMVRLTPDRIDYSATQPAGEDLRFLTPDGQVLPHEIELWQSGGDSIVWVKIPTVFAVGGSLLMRYGDPNAAVGPDAGKVWSAYVGVYHLGDPVDAAATVADSGDSNHDGNAIDVGEVDSGFIGRAVSLNGTSSWIDMGTQPDWDVDAGEQRSFSVWFARGTTQQLSMVLGKTKIGCCSGWLFQILPDQFANMRSDLTIGSCCAGGSMSYDTGAPALPNQAADMDWHLAVTVMDRVAGTHQLYLDGGLLENVALTTVGAMNAGAAALGVNETNDGGWFLGSLDETRVATFAASADWISLRNVAERDQLLTFGTPRAL